jgi:uncharacterized coiled-coil protein SlyX
MALERTTLEVGDDSSTLTPIKVVRDTESGQLAIDYSDYYKRIAVSAETLATNSTAIKDSIAAIDTKLGTIATQTTTIAAQTTIVAAQTTIVASKQTAMETYQKKLKELGETTGIHVVGPYDWLGLINVYRSLIEQGGIADTQGNVSNAKQAEAIALVNAYIAKIQAFPNGF